MIKLSNLDNKVLRKIMTFGGSNTIEKVEIKVQSGFVPFAIDLYNKMTSQVKNGAVIGSELFNLEKSFDAEFMTFSIVIKVTGINKTLYICIFED